MADRDKNKLEEDLKLLLRTRKFLTDSLKYIDNHKEKDKMVLHHTDGCSMTSLGVFNKSIVKEFCEKQLIETNKTIKREKRRLKKANNESTTKE